MGASFMAERLQEVLEIAQASEATQLRVSLLLSHVSWIILKRTEHTGPVNEMEVRIMILLITLPLLAS